jgi:hypothetical protein
MAGDPWPTIDVVDLSRVTGGIDKQTAAAKAMLDQATSAMTELAKATAPKDDSTTQLMLELMSKRGSGSGPPPAPALPPTSTLSR